MEVQHAIKPSSRWLFREYGKVDQESVTDHSWSTNSIVEMSTVFAEVECLVNNRPLGQSCNDANDLQPLAQNPLILGRATTDVPQGPFKEARTQRKRFEYVQPLVQQFGAVFKENNFKASKVETEGTSIYDRRYRPHGGRTRTLVEENGIFRE